MGLVKAIYRVIQYTLTVNFLIFSDHSKQAIKGLRSRVGPLYPANLRLKEGYIPSPFKSSIDTPIPIPKVTPPRTIESDLRPYLLLVRWLRSWRVLPAGDYHPTWMTK